jgi:hypothetical protein
MKFQEVRLPSGVEPVRTALPPIRLLQAMVL